MSVKAPMTEIDERPLMVRVILITYNHVRWIEQAIQSVLVQKTDFRFDVVIIDDCSTDGTTEIVVEYARKYPDRIKAMLAERNQNSNRDWFRVLRAAPSTYVVTLDGDDYWSSPHKLSKQVRFMEERPDCAVSCHNVCCLRVETGEAINHNPPKEDRVFTIEKLIFDNSVATASAMLCKRLMDPIPEQIEHLKWADWALYIHGATKGHVYYFEDVLAVYRIHNGGAWGGLSEVQKAEGIIEFYEQLNSYTRFEFDLLIRERIASHQAVLNGLRAASN
jgi:glycosyltransferase involved in cell wall biosynthesis